MASCVYWIFLVVCLYNSCYYYVTATDYTFEPLGTAAYLPTLDTLDNHPNSRNIFSGNLSPWVDETKYDLKTDSTKYSKETRELYQELGQNSGITGSYATVSMTMEQTYKSITSSSSEVSALYIIVYSFGYKRELIKRELDQIALNEEFLSEFQALPETVMNPHEKSMWVDYAQFMKKWGSHYVSTVYTGSWLQQWSVGASSKKYTHKQFEARACLRFGAKKVEVEACSGVSQIQMDEATILETNDRLFVKGGTDETRAAISADRTPELMKQFMLEGSTSKVPVQYKYHALWDLIRERYPVGGKEWQIARNMEAYYEGYLAFNCPYKIAQGSPQSIAIQLFVAVKDSIGTHFDCLRTCRGCHSNNDCHLNTAIGGPCYCYKNTCIETDGNNRPKVRERKTGSYNQGENKSCVYQASISCKCINDQSHFPQPDCRSDGYVLLWSQEELNKVPTQEQVNVVATS